MERSDLVRALLRADAASQACSVALTDGADFTVWETATATADLATIYRRRAKHVDAIGLDHGGFKEAVADLEACAAPVVRLGQVSDRAKRRHYQLFLAADSDDVIACLWVHHDQ